jgi:hypothetical protein
VTARDASRHVTPPFKGCDDVTGDTAAGLKERLLVLRNDLRQRLALADHLDGGLLRTLADVEAVLAGLDRDA